MIEVDAREIGKVRVAFSIKDTLWEKLKLTKSWQEVELVVCDEYVKESADKKDAKGTIIASDGKITRICVGGKEYSDGITGVEFSHRAGDYPPKFEITADTVNLQGKENLDDFRKFLLLLMGFSV